MAQESACNAADTGDAGSIPESESSPRAVNGNPLQYSCLKKSHGVRSLAGYNPWGPKESDRTKMLSTMLWNAHHTLTSIRGFFLFFFLFFQFSF